MYAPLKEIVENENLCVQHCASLKDVMDLMNMNQKGVIVVLADDRPVGILTERDIVELLYRGVDLNDSVEKYSKKLLITTKGNRTIGYGLNLTVENNIRRIIVVDENDVFLGVVTQQDLLNHIEDDYYRADVKVKDVLRNRGQLIGVSPDKALSDVLKILVENHIGAVPVLREGVAVGIITEKDILKLASGDIPLTRAVGDYMTRNVVSCSINTRLVDIVKSMNTRQIRRVVITDGDKRAINIVTVRDVFRNIEVDYGKFLERKLKNAKEVLNLLPEMLIEVTDLGSEQLIIWANEAVTNRFGKDIIDKPVTQLIPDDSWQKISATLNRVGRIEDVKIQTEHGIFELSGYFLETDSNIEKGRCELIIRDITEDVKLTVTDTLTSVYNRRFINEFLMKEIERSKRTEREFSVVICDIDDFKDINDTHGHLPGDNVLQLFADAITDNLRKVDVIGRYGGDEFIIIMPETPNKIAANVIDQLRQYIADMEVAVPGQESIHITASFGIASYPEDGALLEGLLVTADERMYNAKKNGKNSISHQ